MGIILRFIRNWTLPISIIAGAVGYPVFIYLEFLTPYLIFAMLLVTFCKVPISDLHLKSLHWWLLLVQIGGAVLAYYAIAWFDVVAAEGALVCVICPTATAAAVITDKLGGNAASLITFTILGNLGTAIAVPLLFPLLHPMENVSFLPAFFIILKKVFPLLICPFITAAFLRRFVPPVHKALIYYKDLAFYMWALALIVVMARITNTVVNDPKDLLEEIFIALAAFAVCCLQFIIGKLLGSRYNERITGGQALGQKNTVFAIWLAHTYMTPLSAIGAGSYVVWQNVINSWQLWHQRKEIEAGRIDENKKEP